MINKVKSKTCTTGLQRKEKSFAAARFVSAMFLSLTSSEAPAKI
ncbi:hypothetical protein HMPREF7215_1442 [Pyramidobacter piscolens W5455]|uniref:ESPR domain-containing protein n=1 Tax=Pyramidobacter piscolens W5455 TaxID=352165 RepID=A0ABM9ZXD6_9BACT|nr:hypothetical protein HMPREF7215_1442 [Pyramidobacter piscolens W5455]